MPKVGKKEFPYTKKGKMDAKKYKSKMSKKDKYIDEEMMESEGKMVIKKKPMLGKDKMVFDIAKKKKTNRKKSKK